MAADALEIQRRIKRSMNHLRLQHHRYPTLEEVTQDIRRTTTDAVFRATLPHIRSIVQNENPIRQEEGEEGDMNIVIADAYAVNEPW